MSSKEVVVQGWPRGGKGKGHARKIRALGRIPANIIGGDPIEVDPKWLSKAWKADKLLVLDLEGDRQKMRIQELQINAVKRRALHVDLVPVV